MWLKSFASDGSTLCSRKISKNSVMKCRKRVLIIMTEERYAVEPVECAPCKTKRKIHVAARSEPTVMADYRIPSINCDLNFSVTVPVKIIRGPFPAQSGDQPSVSLRHPASCPPGQPAKSQLPTSKGLSECGKLSNPPLRSYLAVMEAALQGRKRLAV